MNICGRYALVSRAEMHFKAKFVRKMNLMGKCLAEAIFVLNSALKCSYAWQECIFQAISEQNGLSKPNGRGTAFWMEFWFENGFCLWNWLWAEDLALLGRLAAAFLLGLFAPSAFTRVHPPPVTQPAGVFGRRPKTPAGWVTVHLHGGYSSFGCYE